MDTICPAYLGDEHLGRLVAAAGLRRTVADLRELARGVAAAPVGQDPDRWLLLLEHPLDEELRGQLRALRASLVPASPPEEGDRAQRLADLRAELKRQALDGFVIPRGDEHQGEYVPLKAERLAWLTGFTGSAGAAVVLADRAAMFVDGRYTLQVTQQTPAALYSYHHLVDEFHGDWAAANLKAGARLGFDPWLHTQSWVDRMKGVLAKAGVELVAVDRNPLDAVWTDQPPAPLAPVEPHGLAFAGRSADDKRAEIGAALAKSGSAAAVLTQPDSIAWLLNVRGADVPCTPLPLSFAIVRAGGEVDWFVDRRKLVPGIEAHLGNKVAVQPPDALGAALDALGTAGARVRIDPAAASSWLVERLMQAGAKLEREADPCTLPKACKNPVEIDGTRAAHRRDGAAVVRFMTWLASRVEQGGLTELEAAAKLLEFRRAGEKFRDMSFETISGAGPNGAVVHYRVTPKTNRAIEMGQLYLVDSGGQYQDGTTDITRTLAIGDPTPAMKRHFTLVLKGHIALAQILFPQGTTGSQLDVLARQFLWADGLDYDHGTGHGVGSFLSVHEGPQRISKVPAVQALQPGMILSDEPGFYKTGEYGIRIENLVLVQPVEVPGAERRMMGFETLTLCPIDRDLIDIGLLSLKEWAWIDAYHARVREALAPLLEPAEVAWLEAATAPL